MKIKKLLATAMTFVLILSYAPAITVSGETVRGAEGHFTDLGHDHSGWTAWGDEASEQTTVPMTSGKYYLTQDITVNEQHRLSTAVDIELCMNGHSITSTGTQWGSLYQISGGADVKLKIENCKSEGKITRTVKAANALLGSSSTGAGSIELVNVVIDGVQGSNAGTTITMQGSTTLTMTGCTINNCQNTGSGAALYLYSAGAVTLTGCSITNNKTTSTSSGHSVINMGANSQLTMEDCLLTGNSGPNASALYILSAASGAVIKNCSFTGNTTTKSGAFTGAVYILNNNVTLEGENVISGNTNSSGAAADFTVQSATGTFKIVNPTDGTNVNLRYANAPTITELAAITGGLKGTWTWLNDTSKVLAENASHKLIVRDPIAVTGVNLNKESTTISYGESETLTAVVSPDDADNKSVTWDSSDKSVATVDENGLVTAVGSGTADIIVTTVDGELTATCHVTVPPTVISVNSITVSPADVAVYDGGTAQLTVTFDPAGASNRNVSWSSDNEEVATVSDEGLVTGVAEGTAHITATSEDGGKTDTITVTVKESHKHGTEVFDFWSKGDSLPTAAGKYVLEQDVVLSGTAEITADISICLNGHSITGNGVSRVIRVRPGATFNLYDCREEQGSITGGKSTYGAGVRVDSNAVFNMYGGIITGNTSDATSGGEGAGVYIVGRTVSGSTNLNGGVFNMYGGSIKANTGRTGTAIRLYGFSNTDPGDAYSLGTANIYGGTISDNNGRTGTIYAGTNSILNILGGEIKNNTASASGAAIYAQEGAVITISDAVIAGNEATVNGGAIALSNKATLSLNNTEITGNTAGGSGGGIYSAVADSEIELTGKVVIDDNTDASKSNNLVLAAGQIINAHDMTDGSKVAVTVASVPTAFTTDGTADLEEYFVTNNAYSAVTAKDGRLWVDTDGTHKHCLCLDGKGKGCSHDDITWMAWESNNTLPVISGSYYLVGDITLTEEQVTAKDAVINICLNGHTVTQTTAGKRVYRVAFGATVSITDCVGGGTITGGTAGYGACLRIQQEATLNLYAGTITGNDSTGDSEGGGVYVLGRNTIDSVPAAGGVFNMYGGVITANNATAGAAVRVYGYSGTEDIGDSVEPGRFNMYGGLISENTGNTGAVYLTTPAEMTISGGKITGNTLSASGGGIYAQSKTKITMTGGSISDNTSGNLGGGIMTKGDITVSGGKVSGNKSATHGGGILTEGNLTFKFSGGTISGNTTSGDGGGIYVSTAGKFEMTGGSISGNTAESNGGGISLYRSSAKLSGGSVTDNTAGANGGGMNIMGAEVTVSKTPFKNNTAGANGGAIMVNSGKYTSGGESKTDPGKLTLKNCTISGNKAKMAGGILLQGSDSELNILSGTIEKNSADLNGGGVYVSYGTKFNMTSGKIINNSSTGSGGGLVIYRNTVTLSGGIIRGNKTNANAAGLYVQGGDVTLDGTEISGNTADGNGGGVMVNSTKYTSNGENVMKEGSLIFKSGSISDNTAKNGGGVLVQGTGSKMTMTGGTVSGNKSVKGGHAGGLYISTNTTFDMTGGTVKNNRSTAGEGGGIVGLRSVLTLSGGSVTGNYAFGSGGGIRLMGATLNISGASITGNTAKINGGGIRANRTVDKATNTEYKSTINMTSGRVSNNSGTNGGGILLEGKGTVMNLKGGTVSGNTATTAHGGGIYVSTDTRLNMTGGSVSNNRAGNGEGGGIVVLRTGVANLSGGTISGNFAKGSGGGLRLMGSTVYLRGTSITSNRAELNGGGIRAARNTNKDTGQVWIPKLVISGGSITKNTCGHTETENYEEVKKGGHGGGILVEGDGSLLEMSGGRIAENDSLQNGGAIFMSTGSLIKMSGGTIENNHATGICGGIYLYRCSSDITGGTFINNSTDRTGGALLYTSRAERMGIDRHSLKNIEAYGNHALSGGAIVVQARATLDAENINIHDNTADTGSGGGFYLSANSYANVKNSRFVNNTVAKSGGGIFVSRPAWLTIEKCVIDGNTAPEKGGGLYSTGSVEMSNCTVTNNTAQMIGGGVVAYKAYYNVGKDVDFRRPYFKTCNNLIEGNTSGEQGGGIYINSGIFSELDGDIIRGNTAALEGGGIYMVTNVNMKNLTVTENKSGGNGAAFYIAPSDYDGHSYIKGIIRMSGNMKVFGNTGKDMFLDAENTMIVDADGLGTDSRIEIELSEGLLTNRVFGEYGYEGGNLVYTITAGDKSMTDPEQGEVTPPGGETDTSSETEKATGEDQSGEVGAWPFIAAGAAIIVVIGAVLLIIGRKKSKKDEEDK